MRALNLKSLCWKCGGADVKLHFVRRLRPGDWAWFVVPRDEPVMRRRCERCNHEWNEKPLAAAGGPAEEDS